MFGPICATRAIIFALLLSSYNAALLSRNMCAPSICKPNIVHSARTKDWGAADCGSKFNSMLQGKVFPLVSLVVQNSAMLILMRYSMLQSTPSAPRYLASTAVMFSEGMKLSVSLIALFFGEAKANIMRFQELLWQGDREEKLATLTVLALPTALYTFQNNLQYLAVANLSPAIFQVLYQMKVVTAAIFSVLLLGKRLVYRQWLAILLLTTGLAITQLSQQKMVALSSLSVGCNSLGLIAVMIAATTSGLAGVLVEKLMKNGANASVSPPSLWTRNVQMSSIGITIALISCLCKDSATIFSRGWTVGYSPLVWSVVALQALGGLIVSVVMKRADNLLKGFATSLSIILSSLLSAMLFNDVQLSRFFTIGTSTVIGATVWYSWIPSSNSRSTTKKSESCSKSVPIPQVGSNRRYVGDEDFR